MRTFSATSAAPPEATWRLLSRPDDWARWSPHLRGAWGLGDEEVEKGALGAARLLGVIPVPARVTGKRGRTWTWRVGLGMVEMVHRVEPADDGGSIVSIDLLAPRPLEDVVAVAYGPLIGISLRRLAARAEEEAAAGG
jgi:hypothetical protein